MPGLSDLKIKIGAKKEPHNLAWINDKERSVLKAMGGSGKPGPMGIPAYDFSDEDDEDIGAAISGDDGKDGGSGGGSSNGNGKSDPYGEGIDEDPFGGKKDKGGKGGSDWTDPDDLWNITYSPPNKATGDPGGWGRSITGLRDIPYEEKGWEKKVGDYLRGLPFVNVMETIGGLFGPKGEPLSVRDIEEMDRISWAELSGPAKDPDRDGINDGDEIIDVIKKEEEDDEEDLTPMQKFFKRKKDEESNAIGMSQMTPSEKVIASLGIQNRIIKPFEQWLATQEEAIQNLPKWLQSTKYRQYATNRTSPAQSYQPRTASMMASTEVIEDKSPATTELFNRLGMSSNIATAKGGGQILDNMVMRQTGGAANPNLLTIAQPPGQIPLPYPIPPRPEPKPIMPPPPPPEPEIIYDPIREAAAEKAFRDIQARRISELDEAPQTRAEREALQASGGFYRDEEGAVRDAMGNVQEDFGFDYVAPPEPDPYDPPDTPDTPKWEPPKVPEPIDTTPLPPGLVRNPETGEITLDKELAKGYAHRGGWRFDDDIAADQSEEEAYVDWDEQDYLRNVYMEGYEDTKLPRGQLGGGWTIERTDPSPIWNPANSPSGYNYALKGPEKTFLPKPVTLPDMPNNPIYQPMVPMMGQQLQPTGLQGLNQNMQGFGMQSPRPFGQQPNFNTYSDIRSANSYNPAMGIK